MVVVAVILKLVDVFDLYYFSNVEMEIETYSDCDCSCDPDLFYRVYLALTADEDEWKAVVRMNVEIVDVKKEKMKCAYLFVLATALAIFASSAIATTSRPAVVLWAVTTATHGDQTTACEKND